MINNNNERYAEDHPMKLVGRVGERVAVRFFQANGHKVERVTEDDGYRQDEVDLLVTHRDHAEATTRFEVKTSLVFGSGYVAWEYLRVNRRTTDPNHVMPVVGWSGRSAAGMFMFIAPAPVQKRAWLISATEYRRGYQKMVQERDSKGISLPVMQIRTDDVKTTFWCHLPLEFIPSAKEYDLTEFFTPEDDAQIAKAIEYKKQKWEEGR